MQSMKNRRGAIAILMVVLMTGLMLTAAAAVDISRMFGMQNELRTAAEAAALAGGRQLLKDPDSARDFAKAMGDRNTVLDQRVNIDITKDIIFGKWDTTTRVFTWPLSAANANAIQVTARAPSSYLIAQLFGLAPIQLRGTATVWAKAPVGKTDCVKPWAIPYKRLTQLLDPGNPFTSRPLLSSDLDSLATTNLAVTVGLGDQTGVTTPDPDSVYGVQIGGTYGSNITPPCRDVTVAPGDSLDLELSDLTAPSYQTDIAAWCAQFIGPCTAKVVLWDGSTGIKLRVRMVGGLVITYVSVSGGQVQIQGYFTLLPSVGGISSSLTPLQRPVLVQ